MKHFYRSLESSREQALRNTVTQGAKKSIFTACHSGIVAEASVYEIAQTSFQLAQKFFDEQN